MNELTKFNPDIQSKINNHKNNFGHDQPSQQINIHDFAPNLPPAKKSYEYPTEEPKKIKKIDLQVQEDVSIPTPKQEISIPENPTETKVINGQQYTVEFVPKEDIYPAYGYGGGSTAVVRQDLPPRVKNFVMAHELYHCQDHSNFGGWVGREIRANLISGLKDPIGLAATVWKTISDTDRVKFYLKRIKEEH
jgi:hypothetical protein